MRYLLAHTFNIFISIPLLITIPTNQCTSTVITAWQLSQADMWDRGILKLKASCGEEWVNLLWISFLNWCCYFSICTFVATQPPLHVWPSDQLRASHRYLHHTVMILGLGVFPDAVSILFPFSATLSCACL